jgi:transcriptional regulator with XRE-family HTH domain
MKKKPNRIDTLVGSRVRMRRLMLKMSQDKLAGELGLSFQQVQKYELGVTRISASRLQQIAEILKAPVSFFYEGDSDITESRDIGNVREFTSSVEGLALMEAFMSVKRKKLRQTIVDLVKGIAAEQQKD